MVKQTDSNSIDFDENSGISSEDQKEILAEIENIVTDNRIRVTPEIFQIRPLKKGFLFPILVNVFSLIILAAGISTLAFLFMREQTVKLEDTNVVSTAEGKLLKELKKEAEEKLLEKSKEIEKIQARMLELDKERANLQSTMDSRIRSKEAELRTQLEAELNAERERLQKTGMTRQQIDEQIAVLERQKTAEYNQRLDQFRKEVEEEKLKVENNLKSLQSEYNRNLQKANDERQNLLAESRKREEELRKQLDDEKIALTKEKTEAESELTRIADQKQREEMVNTQIIGFYNTVKDDLRNRRFEEATRTLDGLKSYLSEASVISVPGVQKRREVEFFVIDSLNRLVNNEVSKDKVDTSNLIESANLITSLRDSVVKADQFYRGGEIEEAEKFYRRALSLIPEVDRSYNYFVTRDKNDEEERRTRLKDYIQKAETAFAQSSFTETLDNYAKALEYLPETPAVIQSMINQVRQSGFQLGFAGLQRTESQNASGPLNAGNELMSNQKFNEAILAYIDVINRFPKSTQVKAALEGIRKAVDAKNQANQSSSAQLQASLDGKLGEIETLKQEQAKRDDTIRQLEASLQHLEGVRAQERAERDARISEAETEISQLKTQLQEKGISSTDQTRTLEERLDELQNQLGSKEAELQRLTNERNSLQNDKNDLIMTRSTMERELNDLRRENDVLKRDIGSLENQITTLKTSADTRTVTTLPQPRTVSTPHDGLQKDLDNLTQIERDFTNIQKRYERYSVLEDNVLAKDGNTGLLQTKLYLDEFLTYEPVETAFPGLWRRIKVYDKAFEREGQVAAFQDIIDVVDVLARVEGDNRRVSLLDEEINRNSDDPLKRELLQELKTLLQAN